MTPARCAHRAAAAAASAACGLVYVPTSSTPPVKTGLSAEFAAAGTRLEQSQLVRSLGAFEIDREGRRLACLRGAIGSAARCLAVAESGSRDRRAWMVTLTYRGGPEAWRADHMKSAMHRLRQWCNRQGFGCQYVWVAELQKRGVIHYHALLYLPQGVRCPAFDARGWWPHGMTNRKLVRKSAVGYLMKYLSKGTDVRSGSFPRGARIYGVAGLTHAMRRARRWLRLPAFVQGNSSTLDDWRRAPGGGWVAPDGVRFCSEFRATLIGGLRCLVRVARHPVAIQAGGPFSWLSDRAAALSLTQ